ncbi:methyltransferase domain-containing protein [Actinomadura darangshiensis]|uniref:Methyltransferase domain-containing protein n=1 Tax=Actinomadura darangshiensis TaxID=705336 RepID=A0A4R5B9K6_9ACTN|nr:methyltransferase domain-containing protein [Actinomadura darangshiensis]TDD80042.1 methyltransferase domain-containing protein [Actinomadura darangshiensis]
MRNRRVRSAVLWDALRAVLGRITPEAGQSDVVDVGGGTGGFAVPLAELGHRVTVIDSNPDALAALERRAAESGVRVRAMQGDAVDLPDLLGPDAADLVLCHSVLEYVDEPGAAMAALTGTVRPGGSVSLLVAGQIAAALHRAVSGHFDDARQVLTDPSGRWGDGDRMPRRFTRETLSALVRGAGLRVAELHGVRIFADLVPSGLLDADSADALIALESVAAVHPVLRDLATQLHLVADKPAR